jgi:4-hydroxybenzoate polyprenyltransferase
MFSGLLFEPKMLETTVAAALAFCLVSSGVYIMNDLVDVKADRLHPYKKKRPIASESYQNG